MYSYDSKLNPVQLVILFGYMTPYQYTTITLFYIITQIVKKSSFQPNIFV